MSIVTIQHNDMSFIAANCDVCPHSLIVQRWRSHDHARADAMALGWVFVAQLISSKDGTSMSKEKAYCHSCARSRWMNPTQENSHV